MKIRHLIAALLTMALSLTVFTSTASADPGDVSGGLELLLDSDHPLGIPELEFPPECGGGGDDEGGDDDGGFLDWLIDVLLGEEAHGEGPEDKGRGERRIPVEKVEMLVTTTMAKCSTNATPTPVEWSDNPAKNVKDSCDQGPGPYNPFPEDDENDKDDEDSKGSRTTKSVKAHRPVIRAAR